MILSITNNIYLWLAHVEKYMFDILVSFNDSRIYRSGIQENGEDRWLIVYAKLKKNKKIFSNYVIPYYSTITNIT